MKKLNSNELKLVNGGARFEAKQTCTGWNFDYRNYHSVPVKGVSDVSYPDAVKDYNAELAKHKGNVYYKNYNHSAYRL